MTQDRREFLGTLLGGAGWAMLGGCATLKDCQQAIANRPVRRNITTLAANDPIIAAYKSAVTQMKALPADDPRNWIKQADLHANHCPHGNWLFLPWHRAYLLYFERICRKLSGMADFALPYWNWSLTPSVPAPFWGGNANPLFDGSRTATQASVASASNVGPMVLNSILGEINFETFASTHIAAATPQTSGAGYGRLEATPHNYIHGFVGGNMGFVNLSPRDPVFWMHHNMIERCWVQWNFDKNNPNTNDSDWMNREFTEFCDENGNPVRVTVAETLLFPVFSYRYDDVGPGAAGSGAPAPDSKAVQDAAARKAKAGAKVQLDVLQRFPAPQPVTAVIGQPTAIRLPVDPAALRAGPGNRTLLAFDGTSLDHTSDFSVRVFINKPDATVETPAEDPHFAGAFAFFHHAGADHDHGTGNFVLDVGDVLKRLNIEGGTLELDVVLVPFPGQEPKTRELTVTRTELRIAKDIIERQQ
ncbi:MAG TPA: tyrosinase family protein [Kofleriaceae bacterium]